MLKPVVTPVVVVTIVDGVVVDVVVVGATVEVSMDAVILYYICKDCSIVIY